MGGLIIVFRSKFPILFALPGGVRRYKEMKRKRKTDSELSRSALDFNPLNTIASHMCYWADEDVSHFILSQMLSASKVRTPLAGGSTLKK